MNDINHDAIDLKSQTEALAIRTSDLDRVWRNSLDILVVASGDGIFQAISPAWTRILGHEVGDVVGRSFRAFVVADDTDQTEQAVATASAGIDVNGFENRYRHKDGSSRLLSWRTSVEDGLIYAYARDVTAERAQSLELAKRVAERDRLWRTNPMLFTRAAFNSTFLEVNPAWFNVLGWRPEEMIGKSYTEFLHPDDVKRSLDWGAQLASGIDGGDLQNRYICKDGSIRWIDWTVTADDDIFHCVGRDITGRIRQAEEVAALEASLRQSQKMEAVGQLTGGIAHDFNNMLQGIIGALSVIKTRLARGQGDGLEVFISAALSSADRAAALIHSLLAFSRRQPLNPKAVAANPLVKSMSKLIHSTIGEKIVFETDLANDLWLTLSDANQLESAILNLVINARDAMPDGGHLTIKTCNCVLDDEELARTYEAKLGQYIGVCIVDTGTGMSADVIEHAFDPFYTTKPLGQGTGLGLSMIYGFARQSNGYCVIDSKVGRGTRVSIYLPRFEGEAISVKEVAIVPVISESRQGEVVVVVEDEAIIRMLIVDVLEDLGYVILEAHDGPSGLAVVDAAPRIDLLVTDIGLPGLNGRQLADAARIRHPGLKVLFMTGYAENAAASGGFLEDGMSMVVKPFDIETLGARVRDIIQGP